MIKLHKIKGFTLIKFYKSMLSYMKFLTYIKVYFIGLLFKLINNVVKLSKFVDICRSTTVYGKTFEKKVSQFFALPQMSYYS